MSGGLWLLAAVALPLACAPLCLTPATRAVAYALAPWTALPALLLAIFGPPGLTLELPALLVGTELGLDGIARTFLLCTSLVGLLGGWALPAALGTDPRRYRFAAFFLVGLGGNLGVVLAHDVVSFYTGFALMAFAAYGLVIHRENPGANYAGRVYVVYTVAGEALLLAGLMLAAADGLSLAHMPQAVATSPYRDWIIALLLGGFGVKAGLLPLHASLPLAYAAAPTPGAVLLAGAMINAGLLGWLRFLPFGIVALPGWGAALVLAGLFAMFYGVGVGLAQVHPKAMLGYSSISQMGFMTVALGLALLSPPLWPLALAAVLVYATHHGIVKSTLFLGLGAAVRSRRRGRVVAALAVPAVMLAGAPFTSGAIAKLYLENVVHLAPAPWNAAVEWLLPAGAFATALLMARWLYVLWRGRVAAQAPAPALAMVWTLALAVSLALVWVLPRLTPVVLTPHWEEPRVLWQETWPVVAAVLAAVAVARRLRRPPRHTPWIPPGDVVVPLAALWRRFRAGWDALASAARRRRGRIAVLPPHASAAAAVTARWSDRLQSWPVAGTLFLLLIMAVLLLLVV